MPSLTLSGAKPQVDTLTEAQATGTRFEPTSGYEIYYFQCEDAVDQDPEWENYGGAWGAKSSVDAGSWGDGNWKVNGIGGFMGDKFSVENNDAGTKNFIYVVKYY